MPLFPNFSKRSNEPEIMDDFEVSQGLFVEQALREIAKINERLGGNRVTLSGLDELAKEWPKEEPLRIADLGCGGGDMLVEIAEWARQQGRSVTLLGVDANADIVRYARENTQAYPEIYYEVADITSTTFGEQPFDIVHCSLFLHHFDQGQLAQMLPKFLAQARLGVVINDLHRHPLAYYGIWVLTQLFANSPMVRHDARLSVLRGFKKSEITSLLQAFGGLNYRLRWVWAFRWQVLLYATKGQ